MNKREERRGSFQTPLNTELPCRVLVVDDDPVCQKLVEEMLRQCHYEGAQPGICCDTLPSILAGRSPVRSGPGCRS